MTKAGLVSWIGYWDRGTGPNLHNVHTFADLAECRKYNSCMQGGVMWEITNEQMWSALQEHRRAA